MGVVYRARQPSLKRGVALKCLFRTGDPKAEARFAREIRALGQVDHPHLVKIHASGSEGEQWYFTMELIEGITLAAVCQQLQSRGSSVRDLDLPTWHDTVSTACVEARQAEAPLSDHTPPTAPPPAPPALSSSSRAAQPAPRPTRSYVQHIDELVRQVAEAAHALHERGIIHRDIKPGNILVGLDGANAVLMDLGLAQVADEVEGRLTKTRQFVGTLRYASPEQVLAVGRLDRQSNVYSLGATLYELVTLRPLFNATEETPTPELMRRIQYEEPARLGKLHPGISRDLEAIAEKCLQKDAQKRYPTAKALAQELGDFLEGKPVQARPVSNMERGWRWAKRRPALAGLILVSLLAAVGFLSGILFLMVQANERRRDAEAHALELGKQKKEADQQRDEAKEAAARLANVTIQAADASWDAGRTDLARKQLDQVPADLRRWEWRFLQRRFRGGCCTLYGHTEGVRSVAFSPDGQRLASGSFDKTVKLWNARSGQELLTLKGHTSGVTCVAFSPDGQRLASGSGDLLGQRPGEIKLWDARSGQELLTLKGHKSWVSSVAFSPDGQRLASGSWDQTVKLWDARSGQELLTLKGHTSRVTSVAFSPDGQRVFGRDRKGKVLAWETKSGQPIAGPHRFPEDAKPAARHPRLPLLAQVRGDDIVLVDLSPPDALELAFREAKARFDPFWHREQAEQHEQAGNTFAADFHRQQRTAHEKRVNEKPD